jgi:hypothetical protein
MAHSHARRSALILAAGLLVAPLGACLDAGLPWGSLEASMEASFDPSEGRLDEQGRLKTSQSYIVAIDDLQVAFDAFTLVLSSSGSASFDPSNPPPGYSLCHNGHCHSDAGELVDYEIIALEMAGGSGGTRFSVGLDAKPWALTSEGVSVGVSPCDPSPCELPRGELAGLELAVGTLSLRGTAYDTLTGEDARLPEEGWSFEISEPITTPLSIQLEGTIGPGEPVGLTLGIMFDFPAEVFDDIDFGDAPPVDNQAWQSALSMALVDHALLSATLERSSD